jgi:hypothetical protein
MLIELNKMLSQDPSSYNNESQRDAPFLKFIFDKGLYMFWTNLLSIIRSLNIVNAAIGICHASYVDCLLAWSGPCQQTVNISSMVNANCCLYSVETPDDGH